VITSLFLADLARCMFFQRHVVSRDWMQLPQTVGFRALILYSHVILERRNTHIFNDALLFLCWT